MVQIKDLIERSAYGVCSAIGDRIGIRRTTVRLYFIYLSCLTLGSPVLIYMFLAFWMNVKKYMRPKLQGWLD